MKGKIVLETGEVFEGTFVCSSFATAGMLVFDTRVVGYEKVLTSPEYSNKIVCLTYPLIGNYGVSKEDTESDSIFPSGLIISEYSRIYSNFKAEYSLEAFLRDGNISVIEGIDTQHITEIVRSNKGIWAAIVPADMEVDKALEEIRKSKAKPVSIAVRTQENVMPAKPFIALIDSGIKKTELELLNKSGFELAFVAPSADAEKVKLLLEKAKGIYVSDGVEDVLTAERMASFLKPQIGSKPVFGSGFGHVVVGLSAGSRVSEKPVNHYGVNQPVFDRREKKCIITEQSHSILLDTDTVSDFTRYTNINDGTVEGLENEAMKFFTTAFQPDKSYFARFFSLLKSA